MQLRAMVAEMLNALREAAAWHIMAQLALLTVISRAKLESSKTPDSIVWAEHASVRQVARYPVEQRSALRGGARGERYTGGVMLLSVFQQLLDRIIDLVRERQRSQRDAFDLIVRPLFNDLGPLVAEYVTLIREVRRAVEHDSELRNDLGYHASDFRVTREKLQSMSEALEINVTDDDIRDFVARVRALFVSTASRVPRIVGGGNRSIGREITDLSTNVATGYVSRAEALVEISRIESELHDQGLPWPSAMQSSK